MLEFLLGKNLNLSLSTQLTGAPCENGWAMGLGKHQNKRHAGETSVEVNSQNPKAGLPTLSVCADFCTALEG